MEFVALEVAGLELLLLGTPDTWLGMFGVASCSRIFRT
jgi:hypothetical protein